MKDYKVELIINMPEQPTSMDVLNVIQTYFEAADKLKEAKELSITLLSIKPV